MNAVTQPVFFAKVALLARGASSMGADLEAVVAGNSPHSSRWLEIPLVVAQEVAGKPS